MKRSTKKIAPVTGASRGIGRATAIALAKHGVRVILQYGRSAKEAETAAQEIRLLGGEATIVGADLSSHDEITGLARQVNEHTGGRLDALICNAGRPLMCPRSSFSWFLNVLVGLPAPASRWTAVQDFSHSRHDFSLFNVIGPRTSI
jgi:NAD(P)-dependent dehydrogenase (short-subunit alcohol dehydrogenase family)